MRINACRHSHASHTNNAKNTRFASRFVDMCCRSIKRIQAKAGADNDRSIPFFNTFGNSCMGLLEALSASDEPKSTCDDCQGCQQLNVDFTAILVSRLESLIACAPYHSLQWLASVCYANRQIQSWLLDNMGMWVRPLLVSHKQTNVRFSAAILLANLVPNRKFRETFTSNRNMLMPFRSSASNNVSSGSVSVLASVNSASTSSSSLAEVGGRSSPELNVEFESEECKEVLHRIIRFLFSIVDELGPYW